MPDGARGAAILPAPHFEEQLVEDLLRKRNRHLLEEIQARLPDSTCWSCLGRGPHAGIAAGLQAAGFRLGETRDYT